MREAALLAMTQGWIMIRTVSITDLDGSGLHMHLDLSSQVLSLELQDRED